MINEINNRLIPEMVNNLKKYSPDIISKESVNFVLTTIPQDIAITLIPKLNNFIISNQPFLEKLFNYDYKNKCDTTSIHIKTEIKGRYFRNTQKCLIKILEFIDLYISIGDTIKDLQYEKIMEKIDELNNESKYNGSIERTNFNKEQITGLVSYKDANLYQQHYGWGGGKKSKSKSKSKKSKSKKSKKRKTKKSKKRK
jgi:hypothetical protein